MAAKRNRKDAGGVPSPLAALKWIVCLLPVTLLLVAATLAFQQVESFLIGDARFRVGAAENYEDASRDIQVHGLVYASEDAVRRVFAEDSGKSLYLFPAEERRRRLLAVDWVKNATVARIWPNRVAVHVRERSPAAFVHQGSGRGRVLLIDEDGVLLDPPPRSDFQLPVLRGITEKQSEEKRAVRVRRAMELIAVAGPIGKEISEINVRDANNLEVSLSVAGNPVLLIVGHENYRSRMENFLAHYADIQRRLPGATAFDLRLDDRITAVDGVKKGS
jgi:cell division protein FtsQ